MFFPIRRDHRNFHNQRGDYVQAVRRLHDLEIMVNAGFVSGMCGDDKTVFDCTVEWAVHQGIETATFHIVIPDPGTVLDVILYNAIDFPTPFPYNSIGLPQGVKTLSITRARRSVLCSRHALDF